MVTMMVDTHLQQELLASFEELMVKQFRALQTFVNLSKQEKTVLTKRDAVALMPLVEEKENTLDQLGILEDSLHMVMEEIANNLTLGTDKPKVSDLLPHLDPNMADRISRLRDGIISLSNEARDLNLANRALATTTLEWIDSAQKLFLEFYSGPEIYDSLGHKPGGNSVFAHDFEKRA